MVRYQWNIFWADLDLGKGPEQAGIRPVIVISAEEANQVLPIVTVMAVTSLKEERRIYPIEVMLRADDTGLPKDSIAMAHQIRTISKDRLQDKCGEIKHDSIKEQIKKAIRVYFDL